MHDKILWLGKEAIAKYISSSPITNRESREAERSSHFSRERSAASTTEDRMSLEEYYTYTTDLLQMTESHAFDTTDTTDF